HQADRGAHRQQALTRHARDPRERHAQLLRQLNNLGGLVALNEPDSSYVLPRHGGGPLRLNRMTWRTPDTYQQAGIRRGTATSLQQDRGQPPEQHRWAVGEVLDDGKSRSVFEPDVRAAPAEQGGNRRRVHDPAPVAGALP